MLFRQNTNFFCFFFAVWDGFSGKDGGCTMSAIDAYLQKSTP